jgi:TRAP-type C4-dicarboxylate transport system permease small subunit
MKLITRILNPVFKTARWLTGILLTLMVAIQAYEIALREITRHTPAWSKELTLLFMVWIGFLSSADLLRERGHIALEFVANALPPSARRAVTLAADLLVLGFSLFLTIAGVVLVSEFLNQSLPGTSLPVGIAYLPIPVAGALLAAAGLEILFLDFYEKAKQP